MATQIELNVKALGDFTQLNGQLKALEAQVASVNKHFASNNVSVASKELSAYTTVLHDTIAGSNLFTTKTVAMATAAQHLGDRIERNKTTWRDFKFALKSVNDESSLYSKLGQRQIAVQDSLVRTVGQSSVVYSKHAVNMNDSAIKSRVLTDVLQQQNAVLNQGATKIINWGKNMQWAGRQLTAGLAMPLALIGVQMGKMYNEVDMNLTKMAKVYGVGVEQASASTIEAIKKDVLALSKELAASLGISAIEVTDIAQQFAAAGMQGQMLISATRQASRMIVLGEADKQQAIQATISLQTAFKLNTDQVTESVNFFNAAQAATSTNMADLIGAIPRVGPIIRGLGGSYKDMVAIITALKEGGVPAGEAANAIKSSLGRLINPTKAAQDQLKSFGIDIKTIVSANAGNLIGMLTELQKQLDKLPSLQRQQAIAELFGKFQFARMTALMDNFNKTGSQSATVIGLMGKSAADLAAIADQQTKKIQQSVSGRFRIAVQELQNNLIPFGRAALEFFTKIVDKINELATAMQNLPGPLKNILKIFTGAVLFAGPAIMLTGLMGNLAGFFLKAAFNFRSLLIGAFTNGINPFKVIGKQWSKYTEEEAVARNSTSLFGDQSKTAASAVQLLTDALEKQILALKQLEERYVSATGSAELMGSAAAGASAVSITRKPYTMDAYGGQRPQYLGMHLQPLSVPGESTNLLRYHIIPHESYINPAQSAQQMIPGYKGEPTSVGGMSMTGVMLTAGRQMTDINHKLHKSSALAARINEDIPDAHKKLMGFIETIARDETERQRLIGQSFQTQEDLIKMESNSVAQRKVLMELQKTDKNLYEEKINGLKKIIFSDQDNLTKQVQITELLSQDTNYREIQQRLELEYNAELNKAVTYKERLALASKLMAELEEEELQFTRQNLMDISGKNRKKARHVQYQLRAAAQVETYSPGGVSIPSESTGPAFNNNVNRAERAALLSQLSSSGKDTTGEIAAATRRFVAVENEAGNRIVAMVDQNGRVLASYNESSRKITTSNAALAKTTKLVDVQLSLEADELKLINKERGRQIARILQDTDMTRMTVTQQEQLIAALKKRTLAELEATTAASISSEVDAVKGNKLAYLLGKGEKTGIRGVMGGLGGVMKEGSPGLKMGAGMGIAVGGSMLAGMLPDNAPGKQSLSMASQGAGIGMMFGPQAALAGAAIGALAGGFMELKKAADEAAAGLRSTMGATKEEFDALGIKIDPLTSALPSFNSNMVETASAVDAFRKSIQGAADTTEQKQFVEKLKGAGSDQSKIDSLVQQKALALSLGGASKDQVGVAIKAYMEEANLTRTNFDIGSLYNKNGMLGSSVAGSAVSGAISSAGLSGAGAAYTPNTLVGGRYANLGINPDNNKISQAAQSLSVPLQGLISLNTPLQTLLETVNSLGAETFNNATQGGQVLTQALEDVVAKDPQLKTLYDTMIKNGSSAQDIMIALRAAIEGVGGSIDNLPNMKTIDIQLALTQKASNDVVAAADKSMIDNYNNSLQSSGSSGSSGAGGKDNKKIKALQDQIDLIKKQEEERKKLLDLEKKSIDYQMTKLGLENDLKDAMAGGNLLKAAEIKQQMSVNEAQRNADLANNSATDAAQAEIDALQKQIDKLQAKSGSGSSGNTTPGQNNQLTQAQIDKQVKDATDKVNGVFEGSYNDFLQLDAVKKLNKWLTDHKATVDQIAAHDKDLYQSLVPPDDLLQKTGTFKNKYQQLLREIPKGYDPEDHAKAAREASTAALTAARDVFKNQQITLGIKPELKSTNFKLNLVQNKDGSYTVQHDAKGGYISGPGGPTSDLIPAMLSNGEYVLKASAVSKYGIGMLDSMNAMKYGHGGYVVPSSPAMYNSGGSVGGTINAIFNISGVDAEEAANHAVKKIELLMKKKGAVTRI